MKTTRAGVCAVLAGVFCTAVLLAGCGGDSPNPTASFSGDVSDSWILVQAQGGSLLIRPDDSERMVLPGVDWLWSPHGTRLAATVDGTLMVALPGRSMDAVATVSSPINSWFPTEDRLLLEDLTLIDIETGTSSDVGSTGRAAGVSPDGRHVALERPSTLFDADLVVVDVESGEETHVGRGFLPGQPFSPDGSRVVFGSGGDGSWTPTVFHLTEATSLRSPRGTQSLLSNRLLWVTDSLVTWDVLGPTVAQWDLSTGQLVEIVGERPLPSPDGRRLAASEEGGVLPRVIVMASGSTDVVRLTRGIRYSWSPDGNWLAVESPPWINVASATAGNVSPLVQGSTPSWSPGR